MKVPISNNGQLLRDEWGNILTKEKPRVIETLWDVEEKCDHIFDIYNWSGIKCMNCTAWYCL